MLNSPSQKVAYHMIFHFLLFNETTEANTERKTLAYWVLLSRAIVPAV